MAERDVVVRLRVKRDDSAAFRDVSRQAQAATQSIDRMPKAFQDAGRKAKETAKSVESMPKAIQEAGEQAPRLLGAIRAWALVQGVGQVAQGGADAFRGLTDPRLTAKGRIQAGLEGLPFGFGDAARGTRNLVDELTGRAEATRQDVRAAEKIERQAGRFQIEQGFNRQADELGRSIFGGGNERVQQERLQRALSELDKEALRAAQSTVNAAVSFAKYGEALVKQRNIQEQLIDSAKRLSQADAERLGATKQFALLSAEDQRTAIKTLQQVKDRGFESLDRAQREDFARIPGIRGIQEQQAARLALNSPEAIDFNNLVFQLSLDPDRLAEALAQRIAPQLAGQIEQIKVIGKQIAQNEIEQQGAKRELQKRAQVANVP